MAFGTEGPEPQGNVRPNAIAGAAGAIPSAPAPPAACRTPIVQQLVLQLPVEALRVAVLPWRPALDVPGPRSDPTQPFADRRGGEFRSIDRADAGGRSSGLHRPSLSFNPIPTPDAVLGQSTRHSPAYSSTFIASQQSDDPLLTIPAEPGSRTAMSWVSACSQSRINGSCLWVGRGYARTWQARRSDTPKIDLTRSIHRRRRESLRSFPPRPAVAGIQLLGAPSPIHPKTA